MIKLTLNLDALAVDSFVVPAAPAEGRGPTATCTRPGACRRPAAR
jgi:hypothetical protein